MALARQIEIFSISSSRSGQSDFFTPQSSDETLLVEVQDGTIEDLFVHRNQTDQLMVVRGRLVLVVLENRHFRYIALDEENRLVVRIPPGVPHGAINLSGQSCLVVNALLRHGPALERDYCPICPPFPYDLEYCRRLPQPSPKPQSLQRQSGHHRRLGSGIA
jgi:hypothetical protein